MACIFRLGVVAVRCPGLSLCILVGPSGVRPSLEGANSTVSSFSVQRGVFVIGVIDSFVDSLVVSRGLHVAFLLVGCGD